MLDIYIIIAIITAFVLIGRVTFGGENIEIPIIVGRSVFWPIYFSLYSIKSLCLMLKDVITK